MTIQNIHEVLARIMSLNKNLTEESLKTLLVASGWDEADIKEGLRIFKMGEIKATPVIKFIQSTDQIEQKEKKDEQVVEVIQDFAENINTVDEKVEKMETNLKGEEKIDLAAKEDKSDEQNLEKLEPVENDLLEKNQNKDCGTKIIIKTSNESMPVFVLIITLIVLIAIFVYMLIFNRF